MMPSRTDAALAKKSISSGRTMSSPGTADCGARRRSVGSSPPLARPRKVRRGSLARQTRTPSEATTAMPRACRVGTTSTPTRAIMANQKSTRRRSQSRRILPTRIMPITATMTMAPRVASGNGSKSGVRNSATMAVAPAAVTRDMGVRAPALSLAADLERDEPMGKPEKRPALVLAAPMATSSRLGSMRPPCTRANSLAGPTASANATSAMPTAPTRRSSTASGPTPGRVGGARPAGRSPTTWTPAASSPSATEAAMEASRTTSAAGMRGTRRSSSSIPAILRHPRPASAGPLRRTWGRMSRSSSTADSPWASIPSSLGICLMEMSSARPKTKPSRTDSEKNCAMRPSFRMPAPMETRPARIARAAVRAHELGAALDRDLADGGSGHDGDGGRDGYHQLARAAQGSVGQQGRWGRVEGVLGWHSGQLGVGHALGDEDGADGEAGDDVEAQPAAW